MAIDTGQAIPYNENFPIVGIDQPSQGFRDNFHIIKQAIEYLQGATTDPLGVLGFDFVVNGSGTIGAAITYLNNSLVLPTGNPTVAPAQGMIRRNAADLEYHDGTIWSRVVKTNSSGGVTIPGSTYLELPHGTDAQRPGTPRVGMMRYNDTDGLEYYGAVGWSHWFRTDVPNVTGLQEALDTKAALGAAVRFSQVTIDGTAGQNRRLSLTTGNVSRWNVQSNSTAESGSNVGSDFQIIRYSDTGVALGTPLTISRATGVVSVPLLNVDTLNVTNPISGVAMSARYADVAERYHADAEYLPGTVVCFGGDNEITISAEYDDTALAGIISTQPAYMMNRDAGDDVSHPYVALVGRVPCRVRGQVRKGQILTTAPGGYAVAAIKPQLGSIVGKALEDHRDNGEGVIEVSVQRS